MKAALIGLMWIIVLTFQTYLIIALGIPLLPSIFIGCSTGFFLGGLTALLLFD